MRTVVVLGEHPALQGYVLAGARVIPAGSPKSVREAWSTIPADAVVILSPQAAAALPPPGDPAGLEGPMRVVLPS